MKRKTEHVLTEYLVINSQLGDKQAFDQLVTLWYPKLLRYAERVLYDRAQAQDAVQLAMESACKSIGKLKDPSAFPKWVYQVLRFKCTDFIRQQQKYKNVIEEAEDVDAFTDKADAAQLDLSQDMSEAMQLLPSKFYEVIHLHYLEGLNLAEVASILCISAGTVKSRLYKARQLLKRNMQSTK